MRTNVLRAFTEQPWAITQSKLMLLEEVVARHVSGEKLDADAVQARIHGGQRPEKRLSGSVAVLPLFGTIFPRANMMTEVSGATSAEQMRTEFRSLLNDPQVSAIVLDVDSPGGAVRGVPELANEIYQARGVKPVVAVANHYMASAAYWIGSAADELVVTPSGEVGSIGVFAVHQDMSKSLEQDGVKMTVIKRGRYKAEGNPYEPLTEEARESIQSLVDETYEAFVQAVGLHRAADVEIVRNAYGEGRMVSAKRAVSLGMADRVATLDDVIADLQTRNVNFVGANASGLARAEFEREAQSLRETVTSILQGETHA